MLVVFIKVEVFAGSLTHRAVRLFTQCADVRHHTADFVMGGDCSGSGKPHHLLIKKFAPAVTVKPASINDYPMIQNMARFYVYELSKECGHLSDDWRLPVDGLFESFDFKNYFEENKKNMKKICIFFTYLAYLYSINLILGEKNEKIIFN